MPLRFPEHTVAAHGLTPGAASPSAGCRRAGHAPAYNIYRCSRYGPRAVRDRPAPGKKRGGMSAPYPGKAQASHR